MSILLNKNSRIIVQGITGEEGLFHTTNMIKYGSVIIGGTSPGKGGEWVMNGKLPVFDSLKLAVEASGANTSVIFVPARHAADAMLEAVDAGIPLVVCITEGIPIHDMMKVKVYADQKGTRIIGPNCPGIITPGESKAGIIPGNITLPGSIGVVSRSGTLTYEMLFALKQQGLGTSTCVGIGGDPIIGTDFVQILSLFEADPHTEKIVMIGEIGGQDEERAAEFISSSMTKPVFAFIAGISSPPGKRMGHAGAIIEGSHGNAASKIANLENAGVKIGHNPEELAASLK
ncbi:MAG: succinate--CoA ligase subunit alpha [Anaerolinea sp.]|nr:succinate--CoA ligase subunit alpha [Anaerolinea sp.]